MCTSFQVGDSTLGGRTLPVLPAELTDTIIDCLGGNIRDLKALKVAALVCKAWRPRAQLNIFRRMRWTIDAACIAEGGPLASFSHSRFKNFVHHVTIVTHNAEPQSNLRAVQYFLCLLTSVRSLTITSPPMTADGVSCWEPWTVITPELIAVVSAAFSRIQILTLHCLDFRQVGDILRLLCAFRRLTSFTALRICRSSKEITQEIFDPPPSLNSVHTDCTLSFQSGFFDKLFHGRHTPRLISFAASCRDLDEDSRFKSLLDTPSGPLASLHDLRVAMGDASWKLDFRSCPSLQTLALMYSYPHSQDTLEAIMGVPLGAYPRHVHMLDVIAAYLTTLPPTIRTLILETPINSTDTADVLQPLVNVGNLAKLHTFTIFVRIFFKDHYPHATRSDFISMKLEELTRVRNAFLPILQSLCPNAHVSIEDAETRRVIYWWRTPAEFGL